MRLPNGFGTVYKLSGNRRKPYIARKTIGWDKDGKQKYFTVGYFKNRLDGLNALAAIQISPCMEEIQNLSFKNLYSSWSKKKFKSISESNIRGYKAAYQHAQSLHEMRFLDIRTAHLQKVVDSCKKGYQTRKKIQILFSQLYKHALENDLCKKNYAAFVHLGRNPGSKEKRPFSWEEIERLSREPESISVLILLYTGLRISELLELKSADVDLETGILRGGMKTAAGRNRVIPIHRRILPLIQTLHDGGHLFLFSDENGEKWNYYAYRKRIWDPLMDRLSMAHTPHETRHTFITMASAAGADPVCIKRIVGHASGDITERVYTHKNIKELKLAVDRIP